MGWIAKGELMLNPFSLGSALHVLDVNFLQLQFHLISRKRDIKYHYCLANYDN